MVTLVCILTFCFPSTSFASQILIDLQEVKADVTPQIINERTMVPVRAIAEMVGCRVAWIDDKQQVNIYDSTRNLPIIEMQIGNKTANCSNGIKLMDSPPVIINDRTYVPLRFISEAIGYTVDYNVDNGNIYLFSPTYIKNQIGEGKGSYVVEGTGVVKVITDEEISYILSFRTQSWLNLSDNQQDNVVFLIARWWELVDGYVDPDLNVLKQDLNHQMETYSRNQVNARLFETACDIRGIDPSIYINAKG